MSFFSLLFTLLCDFLFSFYFLFLLSSKLKFFSMERVREELHITRLIQDVLFSVRDFVGPVDALPSYLMITSDLCV